MTPRFLIAVFSLATTSVVALDAGAIDQTVPDEGEIQTVKQPQPFENVFRRDTLRADAIKTPRSDTFLENKAKGRDVPELSGSAAGAGLALALGGLLALTGRRKRRETT